LKRTLRIDDSLDVSPVHGVGGVIGTLLTGVFVSAAAGGIGYANGMTMGRQIAVQALGVAAAIVWCGLLTFVILKVIERVVGLRVGEDQEREGLDLAEHGERGYSD
jgi:Amt family ammonium transporter